MQSDLDTLKRFEEDLRSERGVTVSRLLTWLEAFLEGEKDPLDLDDYRLSTRPWTNLKEEIAPVPKLVRARALTRHVLLPDDSMAAHCADIFRRGEQRNDPKHADLWLLISMHHAAMPRRLIEDLLSRLRSTAPVTPGAQDFCVTVEGTAPRAHRMSEPTPKETSHESRL